MRTRKIDLRMPVELLDAIDTVAGGNRTRYIVEAVQLRLASPEAAAIFAKPPKAKPDDCAHITFRNSPICNRCGVKVR